MILYREFGTELLEQVMALYEKEGWDLYTTYPQRVKPAFERSIYRLGAFEGEQLVGFIRCIGDGEFEVYVSDMIVDPAYRRRGIGRTLMECAIEHFKDVDTFALMTGLEQTENQAFYRSLGMHEYAHNRLIGFLRP